jgi:tetratricopeptide (TPR) repeat protein/membrane protease YdiL (CAAX protease family)
MTAGALPPDPPPEPDANLPSDTPETDSAGEPILDVLPAEDEEPGAPERGAEPGPAGFGIWAAVGWCLVLFLAQVVFVVPLVGIGLALARFEPSATFFLAASTASVFLASVFLVGRRYGPRAARLLALRPPSALHLVLVVLLAPPVAVVTGSIHAWAHAALQGAPPSPPAARVAVDLDRVEEDMARLPWPLILLAACLLPAVGEEAFFRGFLGRGLLARRGLVLGVLVTSALFALSHVHPARVCYTFVFGAVLHAVYLATRSLWAAAALHFLLNLLAVGLTKLALEHRLDGWGDPAGTAAGAAAVPALAALAALALLGLLWATRTRWVLPDGREWSPGYVTAESPPAGLGAAPRRRAPRALPALAAALAYATFAGTFAVLTANPGGEYLAAVHTERGNALLQEGAYAEAAAEYGKAIAYHPGGAVAYSNRGLARASAGEWDPALADFDRALQLDPDLADALLNRGWVRLERQEYGAALADLDRGLQLQPGNALAHVHRGLARSHLGDPAGALADYDRAVRLDPDCAAAYANRGWVYADRQEFDKAAADYREAARLDPEEAPHRFNLAFALAGRGELDEAAAAYREAIRLRPDYAEAHCNLGNLLLRQGKFAEALALLECGHELGARSPHWAYPSAEWVSRCRRLIDLEDRLPALLLRGGLPDDVNERLELAALCKDYKQRYAAAVRFYAAAFDARPGGAAGHRYGAACAAARAATGAGDAVQAGEGERAAWRRQALQWLREELAAWARLLRQGPGPARAAAESLRDWQGNADLAGVRDAAALARLPEAERNAWEQLWGEVEDCARKAPPPTEAPADRP